MITTEYKHIIGIGTLYLYQGKDKNWYLEGSEEAQPYNSYDDAKEDFNKVVDVNSLIEVFGWNKH